MAWEPVLKEFDKSIVENGYYYWDKSFSEFKEQFDLKIKRTTPEYLSIDFWSRQRKELRGRNWYILRVGEGSFAIFSEDEFTHPYTRLDHRRARILRQPYPPRYRLLLSPLNS